jgi:hypothetical protein
VGEHSDSDGTTYSVDVVYTYMVDGRSFQSDRYGFLGGSSSGRTRKEEIVGRYPPGARVPCWFDPAHPEQAVLSREPSAEWLFGLIPLVFLLVGAGGIVWTLRANRRQRMAAAIAQVPGTCRCGIRAPDVAGSAAAISRTPSTPSTCRLIFPPSRSLQSHSGR